AAAGELRTATLGNVPAAGERQRRDAAAQHPTASEPQLLQVDRIRSGLFRIRLARFRLRAVCLGHLTTPHAISLTRSRALALSIAGVRLQTLALLGLLSGNQVRWLTSANLNAP